LLRREDLLRVSLFSIDEFRLGNGSEISWSSGDRACIEVFSIAGISVSKTEFDGISDMALGFGVKVVDAELRLPDLISSSSSVWDSAFESEVSEYSLVTLKQSVHFTR
jgi:hypothetical protein